MNGLNTEYKLKFARVRKVNPPTKSFNAAGWDFYVPENLRITDFTKNAQAYVNDSLVKKNGVMSPAFYLRRESDGKELCVKFFVDQQDGKKIKYWNCNSGKVIIEEWNTWIEALDTYVVSIDLEPGEKVFIPSGIHVRLPENVFLDAENKSGIAYKRNLLFGSALVDVDYSGEIHINLINCGNNISIIRAGEKIIQFVPHFQPIMRETEEFDLENLYKGFETERGANGFGSTDNVKQTIVKNAEKRTSGKN